MTSLHRTVCAIGLALIAGGCSGSSDVANYLWGDTPDPQSTTAGRRAPQAQQVNQLPQAPQVSALISSNAQTSSIQPTSTPPTETGATRKGSQRVVAVVNDEPITDFDITQRMNLNDVLGAARGSKSEQRKSAEKELIDEVIKRSEAKRFKLTPKKKDIDRAIAGIAKGSNTTPENLTKKLEARGVSTAAFRKQVEATIVFRFILRQQHNVTINVDDRELEQRYVQIESDPRMKPVKVYKIQEIDLPVEQFGGSMNQLLQARAVEAQVIMSRYKGCNSARKAANGIYNVKIGHVIQAPADRLPPKMKAVLDKAGPGRAIGPMRGKSGIRLVGFCGRATIKPPKPSREVVKNILLNEKYRLAAERVMRSLRRRAYIDYKDRG